MRASRGSRPHVQRSTKLGVPKPFQHLVADAEIEFELATLDPAGNKTSGITRTRTDQVGFCSNDAMKFSASGGIEAWDTERYLNIWVCNLLDNLGYAYYPGVEPEVDGVVVQHAAFGTRGTATTPFDLGRTTTHEVGHYLNLAHIFGEELRGTCADTDFVADTPNQFDQNTGKPTFPRISCKNEPHGDLFMNFMDYVDDEVMVMFTHGQVERMRCALSGPRRLLGA